ncbi:MAG: Sua5/YciO/YrdC/YwlC family protein, partial [Flavobacteriaceae bacterium]
MGQLIKIYPNNPQEAALEKVVRALRDGALIIYPTDTVYGIGCDITNNKALE